MKENVPYKKIFRFAVITSPLFGIFGATPVFVFNLTEWSRIGGGFMVVTLITFLFWMINAGLLRLWEGFNFMGKEWVRYAASTLACICLIWLLSLILAPLASPRPPGFMPKEIPKELLERGIQAKMLALPMLQSVSINIIIMVLLELMLLRQKKEAVELENTQLRMANLEARHSQLKKQLHPHFLFNSLSTLRSLIKRSPAHAEEYLDKLSDLLRSSTSNDPHTLVGLGEEIELCNTYLQMQRVRFGEALNYEIEVPDNFQQVYRIPVYSLQLLVENAIKHNVLTVRQPLFIFVRTHVLNKTLTVVNNLQPKMQVEESGGVGLTNLSERYRLLSNEEIIIEKTDKEFSVTLKVLEDEGNHH